jgi:hypothetical protein
VLYTVGPHWEPNPNWTYDGAEWLDASAYDGVDVHWITSLKLPAVWPRPLRVHAGRCYLGRAPDSGQSDAAVEVWRLDDNGAMNRLASVTLAQPLETLHVVGDLLLGRSGWNLTAIDVANPDDPEWLVTRQPDGCLWLEPARAAGSREQGLWFPAGFNGVWLLSLPE